MGRTYLTNPVSLGDALITLIVIRVSALREIMMTFWLDYIMSHSSFPVIHKVCKIGSFVQIPMEINWKQFQCKFTFIMVL